jgi:hypothetical protein
MKTICVCGGRDYFDKKKAYAVLDNALIVFGELTIIHGAASGADGLAAMWANDRNQKQIAFPAKWKEHGNSAGMIRNREMLKFGFDFLVAFPGGKGTADMVMITEKKGIPVRKIC